MGAIIRIVPKTPVSNFRLSDECLRILRAYAAKHGLNMTKAIEVMVRSAARADGVNVNEEAHHPPPSSAETSEGGGGSGGGVGA